MLLSLMKPDTSAVLLAALSDGCTFAPGTYGIRLSAWTGTVGSVKFIFDGLEHRENYGPFDCFSSTVNGGSVGRAIAAGDHKLAVAIYSGRDCTGSVLESKSYTFHVAVPPPPVPPDYPSPASGDKWLNPGESINAAVAAGAKCIVLRDGKYGPASNSGPLLLAEHSGKAIIDGSGITGTVLTVSSGATVVGVVVQGGKDQGAGNDYAAVRMGSGATLIEVTAQNNGGGGISTSHADNVTLRRCKGLNNGRWGIGGSVCKNLKVIDCETAGNNFVAKDSNGGGGKFTRLDGAEFTRYFAHANLGVGLWFDVYNLNCTIQDSSFIGNKSNRATGGNIDGEGLWFEISGAVGEENNPAPPGGWQPQGFMKCLRSRFENNELNGFWIDGTFNVTLQDLAFVNDNLYLKSGRRGSFRTANLLAERLTFTGGSVRYDGVTNGQDGVVVR